MNIDEKMITKLFDSTLESFFGSKMPHVCLKCRTYSSHNLIYCRSCGKKYQVYPKMKVSDFWLIKWKGVGVRASIVGKLRRLHTLEIDPKLTTKIWKFINNLVAQRHEGG